MAQSSNTAANVLDILLLFNESRQELAADEISNLINAPRSTTYRYIRTLRDKEFLEKTDNGSFRPGPLIFRLARVARSRQDIADVARPVMEKIAAETRETVLLTRRSGRNAVCVERVEGPQSIRISLDPGRVQPLHAGASSKILLAYVPEDEWDDYLEPPLEAFTENTIVDPARLKAQLRQIRRQGYCVSDGEVDYGARAAAVPILDQQERLVAGLSTAGPAFRMADDVVAWHIDLLQARAAIIREQLAFNP